MTFFIAAFFAFGVAAFFLAPTFFSSLEAFAMAFAGDFEALALAIGFLTLDALEDAFAFFAGAPVGIMSPTACMAFEPAVITTPAADVATSPIRSRTPLDFFLLGIECSLNI